MGRAAKLLLLQVLQTITVAFNTTVTLPYATYQGAELSNGVKQWLGIRYAAPPTGKLRFTAPQDPLNETEIKPATEWPKACFSMGVPASTSTMSEDCLFVNIWTPSNLTQTAKLPVYFFIQGGGFNKNAGAKYSGAGLVAASGNNIIVVTLNYRVGPYGFLAGKEVLNGTNGSVNNGLKDQRKALEWVQKYISLFGGDPNKVTLGGASAGAASVTLHLTAYGGKDFGLFHAVAAESQSFAPMLTVEESQYQYNNLVIKTGCFQSLDTLECLRSLNASTIQAVDGNTPYPGAQQAPLYMYNPVLDGDFLTDFTYASFEKGNFIRVPAIYGDDSNEGSIYAPKSTANISASSTFLQAQFPDLTAENLRRISLYYPKAEQYPDSGAYWRQAANAYGELRYNCPGIWLSNLYARLGVSGSYNYHWNVVDLEKDAAGYGVTHTVETGALWGPEYANGDAPASYSTYNSAIGPVIQGYWTSFIRTLGDPNRYRADGAPVWEEWTYNGYQRMLFETNTTRMENAPDAQRERCAYLSSIGLSLRQ